MPVKKAVKNPSPSVEELRKAWAMTPYLMAELLKRAQEGNRTALSIIRTAELKMKHDRWQQFIRGIL